MSLLLGDSSCHAHHRPRSCVATCAAFRARDRSHSATNIGADSRDEGVGSLAPAGQANGRLVRGTTSYRAATAVACIRPSSSLESGSGENAVSWIGAIREGQRPWLRGARASENPRDSNFGIAVLSEQPVRQNLAADHTLYRLYVGKESASNYNPFKPVI